MRTQRPKSPGAGLRRKPSPVRQGEIVDAAMRIIASRGGRDFTARALADEVGVTDAAVFRHFASMDAIVDAVIARIETVLFDEVPPRNPDPIERTGAFFRHRVRVLLDHPHLSRLLLTDRLAQVAGLAASRRVGAFRSRSLKFVTDCLKEAEDRGELRGVMDPRVGAVLVTGAILALGHRGVPLESNKAAQEVSEDVWSALETLLRGNPPGRSVAARPGRT